MVVSHQISRTIGLFGLPREALLGLFAHIHQDIASLYQSIQTRRMADERLFVHRFVLTDNSGEGHLFLFAIDDTTSSDHLMITQISHKIV